MQNWEVKGVKEGTGEVRDAACGVEAVARWRLRRGGDEELNHKTTMPLDFLRPCRIERPRGWRKVQVR